MRLQPQIRIFGDDQHMRDWPLGAMLLVLGLAERHPIPNALPRSQKPKPRATTQQPQALFCLLGLPFIDNAIRRASFGEQARSLIAARQKLRLCPFQGRARTLSDKTDVKFFDRRIVAADDCISSSPDCKREIQATAEPYAFPPRPILATSRKHSERQAAGWLCLCPMCPFHR
jgi:hypothetical protein